MFWKNDDETGPKRKYFDIGDLSIETIDARWGEAVYRVNWCGKRDRLKWTGESFRVMAGGGAGRVRNATETTSTPAQAQPNGGTKGGANGAVTAAQAMGPTAQHAPPLVATDVQSFYHARAYDPMALLLTVKELVKGDLQVMMAHEERRAREHQSFMALRETSINRDADVRIAEAQSRAQTEIERNQQFRDELSTVREALTEAQQASDQMSPAVREVIDQLSDQLEVIAAGQEDEEVEEEGLATQAAVTLFEALVPELKAFIAKKVQAMGTTVTTAPETSGANQAVIDAAVDGSSES